MVELEIYNFIATDETLYSGKPYQWMQEAFMKYCLKIGYTLVSNITFQITDQLPLQNYLYKEKSGGYHQPSAHVQHHQYCNDGALGLLDVM